MKVQFKFKSLDHSQALCEYATEKLHKIEKFELKPALVRFTLSAVKHKKKSEVYIKGIHKIFRAQATADSFHKAVDVVLKKIEKQMHKEKTKVQHHKHKDRTVEHRLKNATLEAEWAVKVA